MSACGHYKASLAPGHSSATADGNLSYKTAV